MNAAVFEPVVYEADRRRKHRIGDDLRRVKRGKFGVHHHYQGNGEQQHGDEDDAAHRRRPHLSLFVP